MLFRPGYDFEVHLPSRDAAVEAAGDDPQRQIWWRPDLCWVLRCDHCGDPLNLGDDDTIEVMHLGGLDDAEEARHEHGGTCEDCAAAAVLGSVATGAMRPGS